MEELENILKGINEVYDLDLLECKTRDKNTIDAKRMFCYLAKKTTSCSFEKIGLFLGCKHATVIHHFRRFKGYIEYDKEYSDKYDLVLLAIPSVTNRDDLRDFALRHLKKYRHYKNLLSKTVDNENYNFIVGI